MVRASPKETSACLAVPIPVEHTPGADLPWNPHRVEVTVCSKRMRFFDGRPSGMVWTPKRDPFSGLECQSRSPCLELFLLGGKAFFFLEGGPNILTWVRLSWESATLAGVPLGVQPATSFGFFPSALESLGHLRLLNPLKK